MSGEPLKLFTNKPKKSKLKSSTPITMASSSSSPSGAAASAPPPPPPPPPPQPQKESFIRRYRFLWPLLLVVNFTIGAYVLTRTRNKSTGASESDTPDIASTSSTSTSTAAGAADPAVIPEKPTAPPITVPITPSLQRAPIPEEQQRALFKWMLEEKRKVKPRDAEEKKRIDEEKAILKQFIRAKSIPTL